MKIKEQMIDGKKVFVYGKKAYVGYTESEVKKMIKEEEAKKQNLKEIKR